MSSLKTLLLYLVKGLSALILLIVLAMAIIVVLEIRVDLGYLNKPVEIAAEQILDRDISMQGDIVLIPTLWPTLEITDVSISNPREQQWQSGDKFAHFGHLRLQLGLIPLLRGELNVADITARAITLNLETDNRGNSNWDFNLADKPETTQADAKKPAASTAEQKKKQGLFYFEALSKLSFNDINVHLIDQSINESVDFKLKNLSGHITSKNDIDIKFNGFLQDKAYSGKLTGAGLNILRDTGKQWPLTMSLNIAGTNIELSGVLIRAENNGQEKPRLSVKLEVGQTDIGATLAWFKVFNGLTMSSGHLSIDASVQGRNLASIIASANVDAVLENTLWELKDKNSGAVLPVKITRGQVSIKPEKAVQVSLKGLLDQSAVGIHVTGAPVIEYTRKNASTPLKLTIKTMGARLLLDTTLSKQLSAQNLGFNMLFEGKKISDLNKLIDIDLPPLGPYQVKGYFAINEAGYQIKNLFLKVGDSQLKGNLLLDTRKTPIFLAVDLNSKHIQINDFNTGDWSPVEKQTPAEKKPEKSARQIKQKREKAHKLLSYENLSRFDIDIKMAVDKVLSGADNLGSGKAAIELKNARLLLNLEELKLPGGSAQAKFIYRPSGKKTINVALISRINRFDYGILARRIDPESQVSGLISVDIDLVSDNVGSINSLLTNSEGHIDFAWMPKALNADLFEMWAVNLITAVLKSADKENSSKVNCVIGRFVLEQGMMRQKVIYADTTRMRMFGEAEANFKQRTIKVRVTPDAKKAEFFSLATPVSVQGSFDKFGLSINPLGLTKSVVSFITSPVHVPVRRLFGKGLPEDGKEACKAMWEASEEQDAK